MQECIKRKQKLIVSLALGACRHLFLNNNKLSGTISGAIDDLHEAEQIYLGQNQLTGTLPATIGSTRPNNWRFFSVHDNQLTGPIHEGMRLRNAYMLDFSRNNFYGNIPSDITQENYSTLRLLYLDHNALAGTIPASMMQMRKVKGLFLNDNRKWCQCEIYCWKRVRATLTTLANNFFTHIQYHRPGRNDPLRNRR